MAGQAPEENERTKRLCARFTRAGRKAELCLSAGDGRFSHVEPPAPSYRRRQERLSGVQTAVRCAIFRPQASGNARRRGCPKCAPLLSNLAQIWRLFDPKSSVFARLKCVPRRASPSGGSPAGARAPPPRSSTPRHSGFRPTASSGSPGPDGLRKACKSDQEALSSERFDAFSVHFWHGFMHSCATGGAARRPAGTL